MAAEGADGALLLQDPNARAKKITPYYIVKGNYFFYRKVPKGESAPSAPPDSP